MRAYVAFLPSRRSRAVLALLLASTAAGCSSDITRFHSDAYAKRNGGAPQAEVTGSIANNRVAAAPSGRVERQPLPQPAAVQSVPARQATYDTQPRSGGGPGLGTYRPAAPEVTGSIQAPPPPAARPAPLPAAAPVPAPVQTAAVPAQQWSWNGGTPIIVGSGDNLDSIARRFGVPPAAILQANNLRSASAVQPGQRLVIPRYQANAPAPVAAAPVTAAPATARPTSVAGAQRTIAPVPAASTVHIVAPGETLISISKRYGKNLQEVAQANRIAPHTRVAMGDRITIPGAATQTAARAPAPQMSQPVTTQSLPRQATAEPQAPTARVVTPAAEQPAVEEPTKAADAAGSLPGFRWPVRGRVIAGFGAKANGQQNDGINLAVPEGTPIKAADDGVVAYSGSELKGYGNLVLIRHANGYVTAYAHASELKVKRGDQIKRGQVVGTAGQTGNVTSPQLHFEIRKGATPVDPAQFLTGG